MEKDFNVTIELEEPIVDEVLVKEVSNSFIYDSYALTGSTLMEFKRTQSSAFGLQFNPKKLTNGTLTA